jgi:hypothetical protein
MMEPANSYISEGRIFITGPPGSGSNIQSYIDALRETALRGKIKHLIGDAQSAFGSADIRVRSCYREFRITFQAVRRLQLNIESRKQGDPRPTNEPYHNSLAIVDRVARTIRDMAYNLGVSSSIDPKLSIELVKQYNLAPHKTLTKFGPGFPISPNMAQNDLDLENYIARKITATNSRVISRPDFLLEPGMRVWVYNHIGAFDKRRSQVRPEPFVVVRFDAGAYTLRGEQSGIEIIAPRFEIAALA